MLKREKMIDLKEHKKALEKRKTIFPYDMLGRSLSANPFFPRNVNTFLKRKNNELKFIINSFDDLDDKACAFILQDDDMQNFSQARRYLKIPLIKQDYFYDEYQILEALVYGVDCIKLDIDILSQKELKKITDFALHLGLNVIANANNKSDLTKIIFAGIDLINLDFKNKNIEKLISLIPNSKIILASNVNDHEKLINLGIDSFFKE